jgi:peptidoglycan lytic transglycosylase
MRRPVFFKTLFLLLSSSLLLSACGSLPHERYGYAQDSAPNKTVDHSRVANAVPKVEPRSKYGNPKTYVVKGKRYTVRQSAQGFVQTGRASWYGTKFHGHRTSSGETYDMYAMTAAHKTLPLPSYVEVHNLDNQRKIIVRVNDRGPFAAGRIIDLSYVAAKKLGITAKGTGRVEIRVIDSAAQPVSTSPVMHPSNATTNNNGQFYLQVGAFNNHDKASQLLNRLVKSTQQNVSINRKTTGNYSLYRVRIGPLRSEAALLKLRAQLAPLGINSPHIVVE